MNIVIYRATNESINIYMKVFKIILLFFVFYLIIDQFHCYHRHHHS